MDCFVILMPGQLDSEYLDSDLSLSCVCPPHWVSELDFLCERWQGDMMINSTIQLSQEHKLFQKQG